ncbi:MAG: hypothetical protein WD825_14805 [Gemmatimonadaceae bacterium]
MPVTAKLSKLFYERLGEQVVNELVDWFNQVDATYKSDLREMNELNFARFDAKVEQRFAELRAELRTEFRDGLAALRSELKSDIGALDRKIDLTSTDLARRLDLGFADMRTWIERTLRQQARWFIAAWSALGAALAIVVALLIGLWFRLP